jgi:hypothetical protein
MNIEHEAPRKTMRRRARLSRDRSIGCGGD